MDLATELQKIYDSEINVRISTKPDVDKAYGIGKLRDVLGISLREMIFVGDALFAGGNDYPAEQAGVVSVCVRGPHETKRVIEMAIACLSDHVQEAICA